MIVRMFSSVASILDTFWFWVILGGIILLGIILFYLTGFIRIHKGYLGIIEEMGKFKGVFKAGFYYFHPLYGRRVGMYKTGIHVQDIIFKQELFRISYFIEDVKTFHYAGHNVMQFIDKIIAENKKVTVDQLGSLLTVYGMKVENIEPKN
ncbi:MAG: hypothetical protein ACOX3K_00380 [Bacilli bacterium]